MVDGKAEGISEGMPEGIEETDGAWLMLGEKEGTVLTDGIIETVGLMLGVTDSKKDGWSLGEPDGINDGKAEPPLPLPSPLPSPLPLPLPLPGLCSIWLFKSRSELTGERSRNAIATRWR